MRPLNSGYCPVRRTGAGRAPAWQHGAIRAVGLIFCLAILTASFQASAASPAETFVENSIRKGSAILDNTSLDMSERDREFREFILSITDMKRVALFTLGPYANAAPEEAVAAFLAAYTDLDVALYRNGFKSYARTTKITGSTIRSADDVIVNAEASDANGKSEPMNVAFRVRKDDKGRDIIVDVQVGGAWLALSQRQDFTSYLELNGGDIAKLSRELKIHSAK